MTEWGVSSRYTFRHAHDIPQAKNNVQSAPLYLKILRKPICMNKSGTEPLRLL
jgi:hypothetical protein